MGLFDAFKDPGKLLAAARREQALLEYHRDRLRAGDYKPNDDGSITTVNIIGVPFNGRIYNVPGYDYKTGENMDRDEALKRWKREIESNVYPSYPEAFEGEISDHPANVNAFNLHQIIEAEGDDFRRGIVP
jgi:hypothetical protein